MTHHFQKPVRSRGEPTRSSSAADVGGLRERALETESPRRRDSLLMAPLKQKEAVILFNTFLLGGSSLSPTATIGCTVRKSQERYNGTPVFTTSDTLHPPPPPPPPFSLGVKGQLNSQVAGERKYKWRGRGELQLKIAAFSIRLHSTTVHGVKRLLVLLEQKELESFVVFKFRKCVFTSAQRIKGHWYQLTDHNVWSTLCKDGPRWPVGALNLCPQCTALVSQQTEAVLACGFMTSTPVQPSFECSNHSLTGALNGCWKTTRLFVVDLHCDRYCSVLIQVEGRRVGP